MELNSNNATLKIGWYIFRLFDAGMNEYIFGFVSSFFERLHQSCPPRK